MKINTKIKKEIVMAILEQFISTKDQKSNRTIPSLKTAFTQFGPLRGTNNRNSEIVKRIIEIVESNSNWLNIKMYRENIEKIVIRREKGNDHDKGNCVYVGIHYNLRKNK